MADRLMIDVFIDTKNLDAQLQKLASKKITIGANGSTSKPLDALAESANTASNAMTKLVKHIAQIPLKFAQWYLVGGAITSFIGAIKTGVRGVIELDKAMTNVSFTMDLTKTEMNSLVDSSFAVAEGLNSSVKEAMIANQIFSNMSATLEEVNQKTETTIALANLTGTGVSKMADAVQGISFQFDLASSKTEELSDVLVTLAQQTGVEFSKSIQGMSDAVARAGSVAEASGYSYAQFLATISVVQEETRLAGQTIAAGLVTTLSRLNSVSDASAEEISRVETALKKVGVQLRDSNGEFRNSYTVLEELSAVYEHLDSVTQSELGFLIAGTRQRKIFNAIMKNTGTISERATMAMDNEGETMRLNAIYAESLEGKINDFKNSMEKLFYVMVSSDALKSIVDGGTAVIDVLTEISESFGLLRVVVAISMTTLMAFKAEAVWGLAIAIKALSGTLLNSLAVGLAVANAKMVALTWTAGTLKLAMGAVSLAIGLVVVGIGMHQRAEKELIISIEKGTEAILEKAKGYEELNKAQRENLVLEANNVLAETTGKLAQANKQLGINTASYEFFKKKQDEIIEKQKQGIALTNSEISSLEKASKNVGIYSKAVSDNKTIIKSHNLALAISIGDLRGIADATKAMTEETEISSEVINDFSKEVLSAEQASILFKESLDQLNETGEISARNMALLIDQFPELAEELSINTNAIENYEIAYANMSNNQLVLQREITKSAIAEAKKRILAYQTEMVALAKLIDNMPIDKDMMAEKKYIRTSVNLSSEISALNDLQSRYTATTNVIANKVKVEREASKDATKSATERKTATKDIAEMMTAEELALSKVNRELSLLEAQHKQGLTTDASVIAKMKEKQTALHNLKVAQEKSLAVDKLTIDEQDKLRDSMAGLSAEWWSVQDSINSLRENALTPYQLSIAQLTREIKLLQEQEALGWDNQDEIISKMKEKQILLHTQADLLREERSKLAEGTKQYEEKTNAISDLSSEYMSLSKSIQDMINKTLEEEKRALEDLAKGYETDLKDAVDESIEILEDRKKVMIDAIDDEIDALEERTEAEIKAYESSMEIAKDRGEKEKESLDILINGIEEKIKAIKEENKAKEDSNALAEKELELAKEKERRNNILNQKIVKIYRKGLGFVFEADPEELRKNAENIENIERDLSQFKEDLAYNETAKKLETEKDALEESKRLIADRLDTETKALQKAMEMVKERFDEEKEALLKSKELNSEAYDDKIKILNDFNTEWKKQLDKNGIIQDIYFSDTISGYKDMVDKINNTLSQIKTITGTTSGGGTSQGGTGGLSESDKQKIAGYEEQKRLALSVGDTAFAKKMDAKIQELQGGSQQASATWSDSSMSKSDQDKVNQWKALYASAKASGDSAMMKVANDEANKVRAIYGFTGGISGTNYASLDSGGVITKDGFVMAHADEPFLNPAQVDRVTSSLNIQGGTPKQSAKNLFGFSNSGMPSINSSSSSAVTNNKESILIDKVIIERVDNMSDFVGQVRIMARNKS